MHGAQPLTHSGIVIRPDMPVCQTDLPLDWYQEEFKQYAEEYLALPDRLPETVLSWMDRYIKPALDHFGPQLMLLAHYYMGGEIVKLVERYGGSIADSYALALQTRRHPETKLFVESAVHFMAESIALLAGDDQEVYITNPRAGCTMELLAKDYMVEPAFEALRERFGDELLMIAYMNTSGRVKALAGETGGAVCTSSNAARVLQWALSQQKKIFFVPDQHLAENTARTCGMALSDLYVLPSPTAGSVAAHIDTLRSQEKQRLDDAQMIVWGSSCGVHTVFTSAQVRYWQERDYRVLAHPECTKEVVEAADGSGSTHYLWHETMDAQPGTSFAIATEGHFVRNLREQATRKGITVVNLADVPDHAFGSMGCGCATMSRNDPPHLVAMLDMLKKGCPPDINRVRPGDIVNERTGRRERLTPTQQQKVILNARASLERMIEITNQ